MELLYLTVSVFTLSEQGYGLEISAGFNVLFMILSSSADTA